MTPGARFSYPLIIIGLGLFLAPLKAAANWGGSDYTWVGDFNGDHKTDIASANGGSVYVYLSTGSGNFTVSTWPVPNTWGGPGYTWVGDFNGDGKSDIASANMSTIYMLLSTGSGFTSQIWEAGTCQRFETAVC